MAQLHGLERLIPVNLILFYRVSVGARLMFKEFKPPRQGMGLYANAFMENISRNSGHGVSVPRTGSNQ
jgi:hypothetical protein